MDPSQFFEAAHPCSRYLAPLGAKYMEKGRKNSLKNAGFSPFGAGYPSTIKACPRDIQRLCLPTSLRPWNSCGWEPKALGSMLLPQCIWPINLLCCQNQTPKGLKPLIFHIFFKGFEGPGPVPKPSPGLGVHFPVRSG